jgi:hypothetical protein
MRLSVAITLIATLTLAVALPICAEVYVVDGATGDDANDGIAAPFKTIARGANAVGPGDTLRIVPMDEPYREGLRMDRHGLRGAPIIIEGGGAVLTGADPVPGEGWTEQDGIWQVPLAAHDRMMLFGSERLFIKGAGPTTLEPEQWRWAEGTLYFRPAEGKTPADYELLASIDRAAGFSTNGAGLIIVRDLTCINFWNDGYNLHGGSGPLWFENIVGNYNGDEGFSAHENAECYVRGGEFNYNYWHGINDIIFSRTHFVDVTCIGNLSKGARFNGGMHSLTDCEISGSPINVELLRYSQTPFPQAEQHPLAVSFTNLRNTIVRSEADEVGVYVGPNSEAVIEHCMLLGGEPVINVQPEGKAFLMNSVVSGGGTQEVISAGAFIADHNVYYPGRLRIDGTEYAPDAFAAYSAATGNDANSVIADPVLNEGGTALAADTPGFRGAESGSYGGFAVGPEDRSRAVPGGGATGVGIVEGTAEELEGEARRVTYDFETENPWSRIYPEPEASAGGVAVAGSSELAPGQVHSGQNAARVTVTTPAAPPAGYNIKLFSQNLPLDREIRRISFWLYGDGSGRSMGLRIRDGSHENFYAPRFTADWEGWQEVTWDLDAEPPTMIAGGNQSLRQDGPTFELVLEIQQTAGEEMTLFIDDLVLELAPDGWQTPVPAGQPAPEPQVQAPPADAPAEFVPLVLPAPAAPAPAGQVAPLPDGGTRYTWDFEASDPWNRIYLTPETSQAGVAPGGLAQLSDEQAHAGGMSGKVLVQLPPGPPANFSVRLFSARFQFFAKPIRRIAFWVYTEAPLPYTLRVRDNRGEGFWSAERRLTGTGWQRVEWDLQADPPRNVRGGDENGVQNGPPMEIIMEYPIRTGTGWTEHTIYVDDLEVDLEP